MAKVSEATVGSKHGRWTIDSLERAKLRLYALCTCECGTRKRVEAAALGKGSGSCGCLHSEVMRTVSMTHGKSKTKTYKIWQGMWNRCSHASQTGYENYKDKSPPERWKDYANFLADMGECPEGYSIERDKTLEPYGPDNCRWIPLVDQGANKRTNVYIKLDGERIHLSGAKKMLGVPNSSFYAVRARGGSIAAALKIDASRVEEI